jgi:bifunctional ADP-heptose synthase (sugar kinase/adenylyltransferase)
MKILVIGEICVDIFRYCTSNRLSPEAPVPVLIPTQTTMNAGMAGNTGENLTALSPESTIQHFCQDKNITKTRYIDKKSNHMFFRIDEGEDGITPMKWGEKTTNSIFESDVVVVSDYDKGFLSDEDLISIGINSPLSILDSKRKLTQEIVDAFTFVKLNESESLNNLGLEDSNIITTLGVRGAKYQGKMYPPHNPQKTIDVSGAGDTFTSAFILKYKETHNIKTSINYANRKSSEVVSMPGVVVPKNNL